MPRPIVNFKINEAGVIPPLLADFMAARGITDQSYALRYLLIHALLDMRADDDRGQYANDDEFSALFDEFSAQSEGLGDFAAWLAKREMPARGGKREGAGRKNRNKTANI